MKKHLKTLILASIVTLLPIVAGVILWNQLPDPMPSHWNMAGEVDGWSGKSFAVFVLPLILVAVEWICMLGTIYADPKKANHSDKVLHLVLWIIPVMSIVMHTFTYTIAMGVELPMDRAMCIFMGVIFAIIGNYLPKCKQNYTIGIKIPWTLNSEENWNKTHRFAGILWVVAGLVMVISGFIGGFWLFLPVAFLMVLAPVIYSYLLFRKGV